MEDLTNERKFTIKEVAEILKVSHDAINWHVKKIFPDILQNGKTTYLNQEQITEIKKHMLPTSGLVGSVNTDLEMAEKTIEVLSWMKLKIEDQRKQIEEMQPKAEFSDALEKSDSCYTMSTTAKLLKLPFGSVKLFKLLRNENILMEGIHRNEPFQKYIEQGYFKAIVKHTHNEHYTSVTLVTGKGLKWLFEKCRDLENRKAFEII